MRPRKPERWDYTVLFDGEAHRIDCNGSSPQHVRTAFYAAANRRGIKVTTWTEDGALHVQSLGEYGEWWANR